MGESSSGDNSGLEVVMVNKVVGGQADESPWGISDGSLNCFTMLSSTGWDTLRCSDLNKWGKIRME